MFALLGTAIACAVVLIAAPRVVPLTLPTLSLPSAEVRAAIARDRELAARAPTSEAAKQVYGVLLAAGEQEQGRSGAEGPWQTRAQATMRRGLAEFGEAGLRALRARATERFMLALAGELEDVNEARSLCGAQRDVMVEHGYMSPGGRLIAPELSVRATYKARWNMIFGRGPSVDLSAVERVAYEGFRGLEARHMPSEQRGSALSEFAKAGGRHGQEALAIWNALNGQPAALIERGRSTGLASTELRLRNMALSALSARRAQFEE
jgi:hypothetical protein